MINKYNVSQKIKIFSGCFKMGTVEKQLKLSLYSTTVGFGL